MDSLSFIKSTPTNLQKYKDIKNQILKQNLQTSPYGCRKNVGKHKTPEIYPFCYLTPQTTILTPKKKRN